MFNYPENTTYLELGTSEEIWLEPEHFEKAKEISDRCSEEPQQWQTYLNALGMLGFEAWLKERSSQKISLDLNSAIKAVCHLKLGKFKICSIATDNLFDEMVNIPEQAISKPELAAHFYIVLEVLEEQEQVIIRGFLRYDELLDYPTRGSLREGCYQIPLSKLDLEPNRLLFHCLYLEPSTIPLPQTPVAVLELSKELKQNSIKLSRWLEGLLDETWQAIDALIDPKANLAFATKSISNPSTTNPLDEVHRAKLINLGSELENETIALRITITKQAEEKINIRVRLDPIGQEKYLPSDLKLAMLSKTGKTLQEVTSRDRDNYIQLRPFKGKIGKRFSIEISRNDVSVRENFEI